MTEQKFWKEIEPGEIELEEIANAIKNGCTSGRLDNENGNYFYYELKINSWKEKE